MERPAKGENMRVVDDTLDAKEVAKVLKQEVSLFEDPASRVRRN